VYNSVGQHGPLIEGNFNIARGLVPVDMPALYLSKFWQQRKKVYCVKYKAFFLSCLTDKRWPDVLVSVY